MKIVVTWRIVHPHAGAINRTPSVCFEESVNGVRESVKSLPLEAWDSYRQKRSPDVEFRFVGALQELPPESLETRKKPKRRRS